MKTYFVYRSAKTGKFISYASFKRRHPDTVYREKRVRNSK